MVTLVNCSTHNPVVTSQLAQADEDPFEKNRILDLLLCCNGAPYKITVGPLDPQKGARHDQVNKSRAHGHSEGNRMSAEIVRLEGIRL